MGTKCCDVEYPLFKVMPKITAVMLLLTVLNNGDDILL